MLNLIINAEASNWGKIYDSLYRNFSKLKIKKEKIEKICIACEEIFVNICNYSYRNKYSNECDSKSVEIHVDYGDDSLLITFIDYGVEFDPTKFKKNESGKSVEERKIGGCGICLVNKIMDKVEYERKNNKNYFLMYKKIN